MSILSYNRRAVYDYEILEKYEAGLVLTGQEVKSIKTGHINLAGSYVIFKNNEFYLINASIPAYQPKNAPPDYEPTRSRKLLLHKSEIKSLIGKTQQKGLTLVPLKVYTKNRKLKLEFALGKGKKKFDKRAKIIARETQKQIDRAMKGKF